MKMDIILRRKIIIRRKIMVNLLLSLYNFDEDWCYEKLKSIIKEHHKVLVIPFSYHDNDKGQKNSPKVHKGIQAETILVLKKQIWY